MEIETKKEKRIETKTIISWVVLVLFFAIIVLVYVLFDKKPTPKPASLEELRKITEENNLKLENPAPLEDLRKITEENNLKSENPASLEDLRRITNENSL